MNRKDKTMQSTTIFRNENKVSTDEVLSLFTKTLETTDLFEITELAHHGPEDFTIAMLNLIGAFIMMLHIRWELAIIVIVVLPVMIAIGIISRRNLSKTSTKVKEITAEVNAGLESSISGIRVTKGFNNEEFERQRFAAFNKQFSDAKKWRYKYMATFFSNIEF